MFGSKTLLVGTCSVHLQNNIELKMQNVCFLVNTEGLFSSQVLAFIILILAILLYTTSSLVDFRLIQKTRMFNPKPVFQVRKVKYVQPTTCIPGEKS